MSAEDSGWRWMTTLAFGLGVALAVARLMTVGSVRDPFGLTIGGEAVPRAAGAGTEVVLDLLALLPALLVLGRASVDRTFLIVRRWSDWLLLALAAWVMCSVMWSADRFAAAVEGFNIVGGAALLWATSQTVRDWGRLRLVAAVGFGLLLVLVAQSALYRAIDFQEMVRYWNQNQAEFLRQRNWEPNSFEARQFQHKIVSGELAGFFESPNTFAAAGVVLGFVALGIGIQRLVDRDGNGWIAIPLVAAGSVAWIVIEARSKTAGATPLLGLILLVLVALLNQRQRQQRGVFYAAGVGVFIAAMAAVLAIGLAQQGLFAGHFSNSLDFRWKYWVASLRLFRQHPWIGLGWANFGQHYLSVRLPEASEEIKDPHNLFVRCFVELGLVGGALVVGWLLRLAWEMTAPADARLASSRLARGSVAGVIGILTLGWLLNIAASIDFTSGAADVTLELLRRLLYLLVLLLAGVAGVMRSPQQSDIDARPAPWSFYCIAVALLLLIVHNLIDFSLFEPGVMFPAALLAGAALATRQTSANPSPNHGWPRWASATVLVLAVIGFVMAGARFVTPVLEAEQSAYDGSEAARTAPADDPALLREHLAVAADDYRSALQAVPYDYDYAVRAAWASIAAGDTAGAQRLLDRAQQIDPLAIDPYLMQANLQMRLPTPDDQLIRHDFDRITRLNPNDVSLHQQYAAALQHMGDRAAAAAQLQAALAANAALPPDESKRLSPDQLAQLQQQLQQDQQP